MRRFALAVSTVAALFVVDHASAADLAARKAPAVAAVAPVSAFNWTGFYAGVQAGYQWGRVSGPFQDADRTGSGPYAFDVDGGLIGAHVGYNHQFNALVLGIEADLNASFGNEKTRSNVLWGGEYPFDITASQRWTGDVRGRIGYAFDRFLPYVAAGVAFGDVKTDYAVAGGSSFLTKTTDRVGWTVGGGLDYALTDHLVARVEYRYTDLGKRSFTEVSEEVSEHDEVKFHSNALLAGVSYKF